MISRNVPGFRFEPPVAQYFGPKRNPDNVCFCLEPNQDFSNCFEDGVYSGAGCHRGILELDIHFHQK